MSSVRQASHWKQKEGRPNLSEPNSTEAASSSHSRSSRPAARVAVIPGDGIGAEVIGEALKVARAAGADLDTVTFELGAKRYLASWGRTPRRRPR